MRRLFRRLYESAAALRESRPRLFRVLALGTAFWGMFALAFAWFLWTLPCRGGRCPPIEVLEVYTPKQTSKLYSADNQFITEIGLERRTLISLEEIPEMVRNAFVVTEDKRFYKHHGVDWIRVIGAAITNIKQRRFAEGFSTISMQLARNIFTEHLSREKTLRRKLTEAKVARMIESRYTKDRILELYLNQIGFGSGAYGIETAAQRYFSKSARDLNIAEAAMLAGIPQRPSAYNPRRYPERATDRRNTIIALMRRNGAISDAEASLASAYPLNVASPSESGDVAPYFVEWVRRTLEDKYGMALYEQGLRVYTTLDLDMQSAADRALERQLKWIETGGAGTFPHQTYEQYLARAATSDQSSAATSPYLQGAFLAVDPRDGAVRAMVGGRDFDDSKFNRITQALRQSGSTFKPFVYSDAVRNGRAPSFIVDDSPLALPQVDGSVWTPQNYDRLYEGRMTMREALMRSRNVAAVTLGMELGELSVVDMARRFGITSDIPPFPAIHIGAASVYPLELISAYTAFATLGVRSTPYGIRRVESANGEVLWEPTPERFTVLAPEEAWLVVDMMKDVMRSPRGTATAAMAAGGFNIPAAGKTGTTNDGNDAWFVGYTSDLVAGVWMGMDRPRPIKDRATGGVLAAPAWAAFMNEVYARRQRPPDWPRPEGVVSRAVDRATGHLRTPLCPDGDVYVEYYLAGTEPLVECELHSPFRLPGRDTSRTSAAAGAPLRMPPGPLQPH